MLNVAHRALADRERIHNTTQIARHQNDISSLDSNIGASADGDADVGHCQRRGIVDTVPDEGQFLSVRAQRLQSCNFTFRQHFGDYVVDAKFARDGVGCPLIVAGDHRHFQPQMMQRGNCGRGAGLDRIGHSDDSGGLAVNGGIKRRFALFAKGLTVLGERPKFNTFARHKTVGADKNNLTFDTGLNPVSGDRGEIAYLRQIKPLGFGSLHDRLGNRVLRCVFNRRH